MIFKDWTRNIDQNIIKKAFCQHRLNHITIKQKISSNKLIENIQIAI